MIDFNEEYAKYIRTALEQGRSIEDIGNEFAKLLNDAYTQLEEEKRKAHEEEQRKAVEAQKRADIYECIDALINTLAWYYPMYKDYSDNDIDSITETLVKSSDFLEKTFNSKDTSFLDVLGLGQFAPEAKGPVEKNKGGDVSFDTIVKAFLGE